MTDRIEPALSAEEWRALQSVKIGSSAYALDEISRSTVSQERSDNECSVALIAVLNAALPDSDDRKFRSHWIEWLRTEADILKRAGAGAGALCANEIADALESYLPPELP
ncbi:MAG: hypothetical protein JWM95_1710 [Gemmatimonadetes bacterium]|nr:hypothetical protein [Gemmatimonadota bacterium]